MTKPDVWPGYVPWREPKASGNYTEKHPTHYDWRADAKAVAREIVEKFDVSVNTYFKHPPDYGRKFEFVSLDVWGPKGRGDPLDPAEGQRVWNYLWNRRGIGWSWGIYKGRSWGRIKGWDKAPSGPPDSDPGHYRHLHITYEL